MEDILNVTLWNGQELRLIINKISCSRKYGYIEGAIRYKDYDMKIFKMQYNHIKECLIDNLGNLTKEESELIQILYMRYNY